MPQAEERPYCNGTAPLGYQAAGGEVDRGDVICVESMAEAECVGEDSGGEELRMIMQDGTGNSPDDEVDGDEKGDEAQGWSRDC